MIPVIILFFIVYTLSIGVIVSIGFFLQRDKEWGYQEEDEKIDIQEITVLIPFRNEEHRIGPLLNCIRQLNRRPSSFIFIDDHSNDRTVELIEKELIGMQYRILTLPEVVSGKKRALRYATERVTSEYILTMDADVEFTPDYFNSIHNLGKADMYVLPAIMIPKHTFEHLYELDLVLVNAANAGLSGLARPIIASGANLLYNRQAFHQVDNFESHAHAASGDDTYLLRDFRENKKDVRLVSDPDVAITTETPQSFREFIDQRLRWIGKTGDLKDHLSTMLAIVQAVLTLFFFVLLIISIVSREYKMLVLLFGMKSFVDLFLFFPFFNRINRLKTWAFIPLYELLFPIYTLILLVLLPLYKPKWKDRKIYSSNAKSISAHTNK